MWLIFDTTNVFLFTLLLSFAAIDNINNAYRYLRLLALANGRYLL